MENEITIQFSWFYTDAAHGIPLMDLATDTDAVRQVLYNWVPGFVKKFSIDGFRVDGWPFIF
jgi:glycosidase